MKIIISFIIVLFSFSASAQYDSTKILQAQNSYGYQWKNGKFIGSLIIPKDTVKMAVKDSNAIASKGTWLYKWNGYQWLSITGTGGGGGTTPTDTSFLRRDINTNTSQSIANAAAIQQRYDSLRRLPGSTQVQGLKSGIWYNAFIDSVGVGGGGGGTTYTGTAPVVVTGSVISVDTTKAQGKLATFNDVDIAKRWGLSGADIVNLNSGNVKILSNLSIGGNPTLINGYNILTLGGNGKDGALDFNDPTGARLAEFYTTGAEFRFYTTAGKDLLFFTGANLGTPVISALANGNVGIGRGNFTVSALATGTTAPLTTGTTRMAIVDQFGMFSSLPLPTGGGGATDTSFLRRDINLNTTAITTKLNIADTANIRLRPIAGTNTTITGTYPNLTFNSTATGGTPITLTTTGTSGASTLVGTTLNIPNYATGGGGTGVTKAYAPLIVRNDSVFQKFNVLAFGADNTGVNDATVQIQNAINACDAAGGGEVFFPKGIYLIAGAINATYNSQIYIPSTIYTSSLRNHITLKGEGKPNFVPVGTGLSGSAAIPIATSPVILKSSLTTFSTAGQAIIGTSLPTSTPMIYNETFLSVENIAFQVKNNPSGTGPVVGGINYKNGASLQVKNVTVYVDTSGFRSTLPLNDVTGIETPDNSAETFNDIEKVLVLGMRNGYKIGEHTVLNQAQAICSYNAFNLKNAGHTLSSYRAGAFWCKNDIYVSGYCTLAGFQLDEEWKNDGSWFDNVATVKDTANLARGQLFYSILLAGGGIGNIKFIKIGGANLHSLTNDEGIASSFSSSAIGNIISSATVGSVLYAGTSGRLQQSNGQLFYDSTNVRLGIGTATPAALLDITGSINASINAKNTTATGIASINLYNSSNAFGQIFKTGPSYTVYKTVSPNDLGIYTTTGNMSFLNDNGAGNINFTAGGSSTPQFTLNNTGTIKLSAYGAGVLNSDASGNITSSFQWVPTGSDIYYNTGKVGIGTTTPLFDLHISKSVASPLVARVTNTSTGAGNVTASLQVENSTGTGQLFKAGSGYTAFKTIAANDLGFYNNPSGNISILNDNASGNINFTAGGSSTAQFTLSSAGAVRFATYGAGTLTTDASGNITATSDERLKTNIKPATYGLMELMKLKPITYSWNAKSGNETKGTYLGFSAQNVKASIPYGTGEMKDGYLTLQDRAIMATLVNAVKEQQEQIEELKKELKKLKK